MATKMNKGGPHAFFKRRFALFFHIPKDPTAQSTQLRRGEIEILVVYVECVPGRRVCGKHITESALDKMKIDFL